METPRKITIKLNLIDGNSRSFTFEPPPNQDLRMAARIKEFMNQQSVAFQLPDMLLVIPMNQVQSIEFTPTLDKKIEGVFWHSKEI
ncbi:MAG: hypothetical protein AAF939_15975 [Planctomycetota bacterium]